MNCGDDCKNKCSCGNNCSTKKEDSQTIQSKCLKGFLDSEKDMNYGKDEESDFVWGKDWGKVDDGVLTFGQLQDIERRKKNALFVQRATALAEKHGGYARFYHVDGGDNLAEFSIPPENQDAFADDINKLVEQDLGVEVGDGDNDAGSE